MYIQLPKTPDSQKVNLSNKKKKFIILLDFKSILKLQIKAAHHGLQTDVETNGTEDTLKQTHAAITNRFLTKPQRDFIDQWTVILIDGSKKIEEIITI